MGRDVRECAGWWGRAQVVEEGRSFEAGPESRRSMLRIGGTGYGVPWSAEARPRGVPPGGLGVDPRSQWRP